jgi:hypothetical protein
MKQKINQLKNTLFRRKTIIFLGLSFLSILFLSTQVKASVGTVNVWADCSGTQAYYHYTYSRPSDGATWQYNVSNTVGMNLTFSASTSGSGTGASSAGITWTIKLLRNGGVDSQDSDTAPDCSTPPPNAECGNGVCEAGESYSTCPRDCPDTSYPSVSITNPKNNSTVSGTVTLSANAADPQSGISQVRFLVQNSTTGESTDICTDTSFSYSCSWNTTSFADGGYRVYAEATNGVGLKWNRYVNVTVNNGGGCNCTSWTSQGCGGGCALTELRFTRTCTPSGCDITTKCVADVTCGACTDQCSSGQKECTDSTHYRTCGQYDTDTCLDWSSSKACSAGQTCSGAGICVITPIVPAPKISLIYPFCSGTTSKANIYWRDGDGSQGFWVDIDNDTNWGNGFWNKNTSQRSILAPDSFSPVSGASGSLVLNGRSTYYVRVYDPKIDKHSSVVSFTAKPCGPSTPTKKLDVPPYLQGSYPNEFFTKNPDTGARTPAYKTDCNTHHLIKNSGCMPTSVAMILDYYKKNMGVVNTANLLTDNDCVDIMNPCPDSVRPYAVYGSAIPKPFDPKWKGYKPCSGFIEKMGINLEGFNSYTTLFNDIGRYIDLGDPVLIGVQGGGGCYSVNHAMVVKGYRKNDSGQVDALYVNDPIGSWSLFTASPSCILAAYAYVD